MNIRRANFEAAVRDYQEGTKRLWAHVETFYPKGMKGQIVPIFGKRRARPAEIDAIEIDPMGIMLRIRFTDTKGPRINRYRVHYTQFIPDGD